MTRHDAKRFLFGAHAIALSGQITTPDSRILSPAPAVALSIAGGRQQQRAEHLQIDGIVSADAASVQVAGVANGGRYSILATATVEKLNVLDLVTADRIVARLASEHDGEGDEGSAYFVGSHFENLRIAGSYVRFGMNEGLVSAMPTFDALRYAARERNEPLQESNGRIYASLVRDIENVPGRVHGCRIDIPEFGSIYLGEVFAGHDTRRLTMLRIELGCPIEGRLIVGELDAHWALLDLPGDDPTRPKG